VLDATKILVLAVPVCWGTLGWGYIKATESLRLSCIVCEKGAGVLGFWKNFQTFFDKHSNNKNTWVMKQMRLLMVVGCFVMGMGLVSGQADTVRVTELMEIAETLIVKWDYKEALNKAIEAQNIYKLVDVKNRKYAEILNLLGRCYTNLRKYDQAIDMHKESLEIIIQITGKGSQENASYLSQLATTYAISGNCKVAIDSFRISLNIILKGRNNEEDVSRIYSNIGMCFYSLVAFDSAIIYIKKAIVVENSIKNANKLKLGGMYLNLGFCYDGRGEFKKALDAYQTSFGIWSKVFDNSHPNIALLYNNIGKCYAKINYFDKASLYYYKAIEIWKKTVGDDDPDLADTYHNLGNNYSDMRDHFRGVEYLQKALTIRLRILKDNHPSIGYSYNALGVIYEIIGDYKSAEIYFRKAEEIWTKSLGDESPEIAGLYMNIGSLHRKKADFIKAADFFRKALSVREKIYSINNTEIGDSYLAMGIVYSKVDSFSMSNFYFENAMRVYIASFPDASTKVAGIKRYLALNYVKENKISDALIEINNGIRILENSTYDKINYAALMIELLYLKGLINEEMAGKNANTNYLFASIDSYRKAMSLLTSQYQKLISDSKFNLVYQTNQLCENAISTNLLLHYSYSDSIYYLKEAFDFTERSKSLILYESLQNASALQYAGIPDSLTQQEYDLRIDLAYYDKQRQEKLQTGLTETDTTVLAISSKLFDLREQHEVLKKRFETEYPEYYRLKNDLSTASLDYVQDTLLLPKQSLLSYFVGDSTIYLYLVNRDSFSLREIKKDTLLEHWVGQLRYGLTRYHTAEIPPSDSFTILTNQYIEAAHQLYLKLIAPVGNLLEEEVIIIPDGVLGYIPFEALLIEKPLKISRFGEYKYLLNNHTISYNYSVTLLREVRDRNRKKAEINGALAIAPFFRGDVKLLTSRLDSLDIISRSSTLDTLKYSGEEVIKVKKSMGGAYWLGQDASIERFKKEAPRYRYLHLSTHAVADDRVGDYAYLAFSMPDNPQHFDKFYVRDIYNLPLQANEMVVLSACETGIGELKRGEGIISLARAFAYAGAKSIFTTLWKVDDYRTSYLMERFYLHLDKGFSKDKALRQAKLDFLNEYKGLKAHPFFWASFIGIGDMQPISRQ